jgi:hypothetical protein
VSIKLNSSMHPSVISVQMSKMSLEHYGAFGFQMKGFFNRYALLARFLLFLAGDHQTVSASGLPILLSKLRVSLIHG